MGKVVVFGSFVVDLMARSPHLPVPGETVKGSMFKMGPGGKGFNQCVAAHKAGADVVMVTKLGKDSFANVATDAMDELGMPKDSLFFTEETETGIALILVDENTSQNEIIIVPGACNTITDAEVDSIEEQIKESEYVLLQLEVNQDANERVVDMANRYGCKVIVNTAPYSKISDEFLSKVYMVTPNEVEAEELTGVHVEDLESAHKAAEYFYKKGVEKVIITLGSRGVFVSSDGKEEIVPAFKVDAVGYDRSRRRIQRRSAGGIVERKRYMGSGSVCKRTGGALGTKIRNNAVDAETGRDRSIFGRAQIENKVGGL